MAWMGIGAGCAAGGVGSAASNGTGESSGAGTTDETVPNDEAITPKGASENLVINVPIDAGAATARPGDPKSPEICDGIDNDDNGIIDDVDVGGDGVCDCLNIATVGGIGPYSTSGNVFAGWLNSRSPRGAVELADQELTPERLAPFQVVVVLHVGPTAVYKTPAHHLFSNAEASAFESWVRRGGGVMTTIGLTANESTEVVNVNQLLATLGMGYSTTKVALNGDILRWVQHPITQGIGRIRSDNGVEPDGTGTTLAYDQEGHIALQVKEVESGHVAVWGDEWITYDSEWVDVKGQQVEHLWLNLLKWLSPPTQCQVPIPPRIN
jgi:hypothetical protein